MRALTVDDDAINNRIVAAILKNLGFQVVSAASVTAAIAANAVARFDLVVTDYQMPEVNGDELTKELRKIERDLKRPPSVIVGASAKSDYGVAEIFRQAGANAFLRRPVSALSLRGVLKNYFDLESIARKAG